MKIQFFGHELNSPFIIGSGPLSYGAAGMITLTKAGAGAVVTKTIRNEKAHNPEPHISAISNHSMINAEKWSDYDGMQWVEKEIPEALAAGVKVIASIGHTPEEVEQWLPLLDKSGAPFFELVSYAEETMIPMVAMAKSLTDKPVFAKVSPNWPNCTAAALKALEAGADGITAIDSLGPVLSLDVKTGKPSVVGENGMGWLTGSALKPLSLRYVAEISSQTDKPVIGLGGVMSAEDAVEMVSAGASCVGVCTLPMMKGSEILSTLSEQFDSLLKSLGYNSLEEAKGRSHKYLFGNEELDLKKLYTQPCSLCGICIKRCPYDALSRGSEQIVVDTHLCRRCGLCVSSCKSKKLSLSKELS